MSTQPEAQLLARVTMLRPLGEQVCAAMETEYRKLGFLADDQLDIDFDALVFALKRDPFSQQDSVEGTWLDRQRQRLGSLVFHADGSFFAEFDVVKPHPGKPKWFVEAVTAWGQGSEVKTEARLLPAV
ncbi:MAG: hypothetical protein GC149_07480 [Gammaproteobacteria bacterium]|nr:hypothetical protein [Gammaproteobacteria bacterium]